MSLGNYLRRLRTQTGLGLSEAVSEVRRRAPKVHLSTSSLSRLERGEGRIPNATLLKALADTYRARYAELVYQLLEKVYGVDPRRSADGPAPRRSGEARSTPPLTSIEENLPRLDYDGLALVADLVEHLAGKRSGVAT